MTGPARTHGRRRQHGVYVVELAIVAAVFLFMLFGAFEVSRLLFTWSALDAMTQRGARMAALCSPNNALIADAAIYATGAEGKSALVPDITTDNIQIDYLDASGQPGGRAASASFVRVSISGYTYRMLIPKLVPGFDPGALTPPTFATTRPTENLGRYSGGPACSG